MAGLQITQLSGGNKKPNLTGYELLPIQNYNGIDGDGKYISGGVTSFTSVNDILSMATGSVSGLTPSFGEVLSVGNNTDGNDIIVDTGNKISFMPLPGASQTNEILSDNNNLELSHISTGIIKGESIIKMNYNNIDINYDSKSGFKSNLNLGGSMSTELSHKGISSDISKLELSNSSVNLSKNSMTSNSELSLNTNSIELYTEDKTSLPNSISLFKLTAYKLEAIFEEDNTKARFKIENDGILIGDSTTWKGLINVDELTLKDDIYLPGVTYGVVNNYLALDSSGMVISATVGKEWQLQFFNQTDTIQVEATPSNITTFTSGVGTDVGTIEVSTDGVTYSPLTFPFSPSVGTLYFKRSSIDLENLVTGVYTISE